MLDFQALPEETVCFNLRFKALLISFKAIVVHTFSTQYQVLIFTYYFVSKIYVIVFVVLFNFSRIFFLGVGLIGGLGVQYPVQSAHKVSMDIILSVCSSRLR